MPKPVAEYLVCARRFDHLASIEQRIEAKQLLNAQADTCYRLAAKRARATNAPIPVRPVGPCLVTIPGPAVSASHAPDEGNLP
jgi:hypothetical protein